MRIVFCGTGDIGLPSLRALAGSARHELVGVITQPDRPAGRDLRPRPPAVKTEALAKGTPVVQPERIRKDSSALVEWSPDLMVVAAYGVFVRTRCGGDSGAIPRALVVDAPLAADATSQLRVAQWAV